MEKNVSSNGSIWIFKMIPNSNSCFSGDQWFSLNCLSGAWQLEGAV